jgi:CheY-like chemotaxis protein
VIALTAAASARDYQRGEQAGFYRYLTKPVKVDELEDGLLSLLASKETVSLQAVLASRAPRRSIGAGGGDARRASPRPRCAGGLLAQAGAPDHVLRHGKCCWQQQRGAHMPNEKNTVHLSGVIVGFNLSPKGYVEGVVIQTPNGLAQVNYPKHGAHTLRSSTELGAIVAVRALLDTDEGAHPVYRVLDEEAEVSGKITSVNYSRHGHVNGYRLDDGTFVHLAGDDAASHDFHVGDAVRGQGVQVVSTEIVILEARTVQRQVESRPPAADTPTPKKNRAKRAHKVLSPS